MKTSLFLLTEELGAWTDWPELKRTECAKSLLALLPDERARFINILSNIFSTLVNKAKNDNLLDTANSLRTLALHTISNVLENLIPDERERTEFALALFRSSLKNEQKK